MLDARDHGTNVAFFGANAEYWQVRLTSDNGQPDRGVICYKTDVDLDPDATADPERETTKWRRLPTPKPDSLLLGLMYECYPAKGAYVVSDPSFFGFAGTGAAKGSSYPGLIGLEIDRARTHNGATPKHLDVVGHSPTRCLGHDTFADTGYYVTPSKAGVFDTGTMGWSQRQIHQPERRAMQLETPRVGPRNRQ